MSTSENHGVVRFLAIAAVLCVLSGCALRDASPPPEQEPESLVDRNLREAGEVITRDLAILTGSSQNRDYGNPMGTGSLYDPMTLIWNGPIEDGLVKVAAHIGYRFEREGPAPPTPVMVKVKLIDRPALSIIRDIGAQTGPDVGVELSEPQQLIRLLYKKRGGAKR